MNAKAIKVANFANSLAWNDLPPIISHPRVPNIVVPNNKVAINNTTTIPYIGIER